MEAARRPRYGGVLRIEISASIASIDPAIPAVDSREAAAKQNLVGQVFETLVRIDETGEPRPMLATSWTHDLARKKWLFTARPHVTLHNGTVWEPPGGVIAVDDRRPIEDILRGLAKPENAVVVRTADGTLAGTGPFRIAKWDTKRSLVLEAHDAYWRGRPYLDRVDFQLGRPVREQALDFELAKTDLIDIAPSDVRRAQQRGGKVVTSSPVDILTIVFDNTKPELERVREALALSVDRSAIHNVLLQKQGDISGALLPQWLTGYAFLFAPERNLTKARELANSAPPLTFAYDRTDALIRAIAERIVLNAKEAGLIMRPPSGTAADAHLMTLRIGSLDTFQALSDIASALRRPLPAAAELYPIERVLLKSHRIIPLFHLPVAHQIGNRVRNWKPDRIDRWDLADAWIADKDQP